MKRILTLSLAGALVLGTLATGVVGAHQAGGAKPHDREGGHRGGLGSVTACLLSPAVSGTSIFALATPGKPGGSLTVLVRVKHPDATAATYGATVTPTFPTAGAGAPVTLTRKGTSFVLRGTVQVPASATAGGATLAVAGTYGTSSFTCAGLTATIKVPKPARPPVCTSTPAGLSVRAWATPAMPGGTLWVAVRVKKQDPSATLAATATATIPPASARAPQALKALGSWAVLTGAFPVDKGATLGATATVAVTGSYTVGTAATTFTCSLTTPIRNVKFWRVGKGH
ncbi:MAG: hypothetical protein MUF10_20555 [Thermoanaerobaculaceae bacterium]|jgi:hypothetical protein|nr:hypothetical protein [Thermoanaerobaculaceae bacterium]